MQTLKFIGKNRGISKKSNKPYDILELSDGVSSFIVGVEPSITDELHAEAIEYGQEIDCELHVRSGYDGLRATLVNFKV